MIPTSVTALAIVGAFFVGYIIGRTFELKRSQEDIDILTRIIEGRSKEVEEDES